MDVNKLFGTTCTVYINVLGKPLIFKHSHSSGPESVTSAVSVNPRLSATAAQVKVTAVASCSHMLILQQGPRTQRRTHTHKAQGIH